MIAMQTSPSHAHQVNYKQQLTVDKIKFILRSANIRPTHVRTAPLCVRAIEESNITHAWRLV